MSCGRLLALAVVIGSWIAGSAAAQEPGIHWQQDIEAAKASAAQTGRLVLVHVWADGCGPCRALDQNVFNQPNVGSAVEAKFVPVKLNANEYPATAQGFGITRVPTDVILTPDGRVLSKTISPATPMAYIAEVTQVSTQYAARQGATYQTAAAAAPQQPALNSAYATLPVGSAANPAAAGASPSTAQLHIPNANTTSAPLANERYALAGQTSVPFNAPANPYAMNQPAATLAPPKAATTPAAVVSNTYAMPGPQYQTPAQSAPQTTMPNAASNFYAPAQAGPQYPSLPPAAASQLPTTTPATPFAPAYGTQPGIAAPQDTSAAPANSGGVPLSAEAMNSRFVPPVANAQYPQATGASPIAAAVAANPAVPDVSKLPAGAPPLGFDGYCPVTMRTTWKWIPGDAKYGAIHRGRTYWFASPREQQQFLANPDFYSPALSGIDPVLAIDHRQSVPGTREHSLDYDNQFYMFSSEATLQQFTANPERYATGVRQAMGLQPKRQMR